jgi:hypothetical protein
MFEMSARKRTEDRGLWLAGCFLYFKHEEQHSKSLIYLPSYNVIS